MRKTTRKDSTKTSQPSVSYARRYLLQVAEDGSFRAEHVAAGNYYLVARLESRCYGPVPSAVIAFLLREFAVSAVPVERAATPVDLGAIELEPLDRLHVGDPVPPFELKTVEGAPLKLSDYAGRHVLVTFWATTSAPCIKQIPDLKDTYDAFARTGRIVMIGLSLDSNPDRPRKLAEQYDLKWIQGFIDPDPPVRQNVQRMYNLFFAPLPTLLIGPDGTLLARIGWGQPIRSTVAHALSPADSSR